MLALATAACAGSTASTRVPADTLHIGVAAARNDLTSAYFDGVRLAIDDLNARRAAGQPPFALRMPLEDQTRQVAVAAAFRDDPAVIGVVGHTGSAQTLEAAPIYGDLSGEGRAAVVAVTPTATNPLVTRASPWVFRVCPTDIDAARALARFTTDSLAGRRAAVIYRNDLFGRGFSRTFQEAFESTGGRVLERDPYLSGITEFEAYAGRIARRRADVLVIAGGANDAAEIIRTLLRTGARPHVLGSDDLAGLGMDTAAAREFAGVRYTSFFLPYGSPDEHARDFIDRYRARFGVSPDHRAALSYDAAMLIGEAALAVGGDRRAIREHIAETGRGRAAYTGVTGRITFDQWGNPVDKPVRIAELAP